MTDSTAASAVRKPKILLVEDNDTYRKVVKNAMSIFGFEVSEAANGAQALEMIRMAIPDIILADVYMPVMDGLSMLTQIKKDARLTNVPVVMVTNVQEELDTAVKAGAEEAVLKSSLTPHQLIDVCKKHLAPELASSIVAPPPVDLTGGPVA